MNRPNRRTLLAILPVLLLGAGAGAALRPRALSIGHTDAIATVSFLPPAAAVPADTTTERRAPVQQAEGRALWVNRWDYGSAETIRQVMDIASRAHFNIVYFQVRGPSDARYRSQLDPCSALLCGRLGGVPTWDPLEVAVREAHARGLQLHAWINALSGWESVRAADCDRLVRSVAGQPNHILIDHPEWAMHTRLRLPMGCPNGPDVEYVYLSPGVPEVRTHLARVAADVVRRYQVDGVHLDRIRYPGDDYGYDRASLAEFGRSPSADPTGWSQYRRGLVSKMVREVHD